MQQTDEWTIGRLLTWTTDYLKKHQADSPRLDAELLLAEARQCERIQLYTDFDQVPGEEALAKFRELVRGRANGTPVAYLVGRKEFFSLSFQVTPDVLIPRPETETLVVEMLDLAKERPNHSPPFTIADVGTGSGIIAICAAVHLPNSQVTAIDVSESALEVARANAKTHQVDGRVDFVLGDLLDRVSSKNNFDMIVSNPPYIAESEVAQLSRDVRDYEPRGALVSGPAGTEIIARLIEQAANRLVPSGWLLMEISPMIEPQTRELLAAHEFDSISIKSDLAGLPRVAMAQRTP